MLDKNSLLLCGVTDRRWAEGRTLAAMAQEAAEGGVTMLQLREKNISYAEFLRLAKELKTVTDKFKIPLIINDEADICVLSGADGLHIGQSDGGVKRARRKIGKNKILGVSVSTPEQAAAAQKDGADYLGVGAVFPTGTKEDAALTPPQKVKEICAAVRIPVIAIGGINKDTLKEVGGLGLAGIAVVSAIFAQKNIRAAAENLKRAAKEFL